MLGQLPVTTMSKVPESCTLNKAFIDIVHSPINRVWNDCAADIADANAACGEGEVTNMEAIEICIDADRLTMTGFKEANDSVMAQIKIHGYHKVLRYLSKHIHLM
jgi:hypothetical protein